MSKKQFACEMICPNCGNSYEGYNGGYIYNGEYRCPSCMIKRNEHKGSFFVQNIPAFVDGVDCDVWDFKDIYDLAKHLKISEDEILVYSNNYLIAQNIKKSFWWVLGSVNGIEAKNLGIPKADYNIYDENDIAIPEKVNLMIKNKIIISKGI